jgi:hypothetical protein
MSFFEPLPPPPPEAEQPAPRPWSPPAWDRPSEGTLPVVLGVSQLFGRNDGVALALDHLRVYPNGFQLVVTILTSPHLPPELRGGGFATLSMLGAGTVARDVLTARRPLAARGPRLGVEFSNGQRAGHRLAPFFDVAKDERGFPTEPVMMGGGGGGGGGHFRFEHWVFPLPTPGPLTVHAEWSTAALPEMQVVVSGDDVRAAAERATVLWS